MRRNEIIVLCVAASALAIVLIGLTLPDVINAAQCIEIIITFVLVLVTAGYVRRTAEIAEATREQAEATRRQADASMEMAREMKEQTYDAFRPVIDIVKMPMEPMEMAKQAYCVGEGKFPELPCILHNIGVGPAIGVSSFIIVPSSDERRPWDFGTIAVGEKTLEKSLSLEQTGNRMALVAYYKDVYGRDIESRREVTLDKEKHS